MGTFAEAANVDYHLSFADLGIQTSVFRFPLVPFSIHIYIKTAAQLCIHVDTYKGKYIYMFIYVSISIYLYLCIYMYIYAAVSHGKRKMEAQAIFLNPFTACSSCKWKLSVCKRTKRTE
jgi:hypothetical protein